METNEFLSHYGIPGMRWGKHKSSYDKSVKIYGGTSPHRNLSADPKSLDAMKVRNYQARAKKAGTDTLSNKELKDLVNRMNLEEQYTRLNPAQVSAGRALATSLLPAIGGALYGQYQARQPQKAPSEPKPMSTDLAARSRKKLVADILLSAGKQVLASEGQVIAKQAGQMLVNAMLKNMLK